MSDYQALDNKIETLRKEVNSNLGSLRADVKELTAALRELVRIDTETKRQNDSVMRLRNDVDGLFGRVRNLELNAAGSKHHEKLINWIYVAASSLFTGLVVYLVAQ